MPTIDERIAALEAAVGSHVAGTQLTRCLAPVEGVQWCLGLGGMQMPKAFFYGATIEEVLTIAETEIANRAAAGEQPVVTEMEKLSISIQNVCADM